MIFDNVKIGDKFRVKDDTKIITVTEMTENGFRYEVDKPYHIFPTRFGPSLVTCGEIYTKDNPPEIFDSIYESDMNKPLVSIITATTGNPLLSKCVRSVLAQSHERIQHLIIADGPETHIKVTELLGPFQKGPFQNSNLDVVYLPYSIGKDRWNGHRMYGAGTFISEGQFLIYLDDDNALHPDHIKNCLEVINSGKQWSYSFRNIVDENHAFICQDNCESLGRWPSVLNPNDYFIDVNCYFLPRNLALSIVPVWWRKFREPGQPEIDRAMISLLNRIAPNFDSTYKYTVDYKVGNSQFSVQSDFFIKGNEAMLKTHNGKLPWVKE